MAGGAFPAKSRGPQCVRQSPSPSSPTARPARSRQRHQSNSGEAGSLDGWSRFRQVVRTPLILFTVYTWLGSMVRDDEPERPMTLSANITSW